MRGLSSLPLDDDIIDRILIFLPNLAALSATILSSKAFHAVFKMHPNSILRAVCYNMAGPALPQAMRALRYSPPQPDSTTANSQQTSQQASPTLPSPWAETDSLSPISPEEARALAQNSISVNALEDLFSSRHEFISSF